MRFLKTTRGVIGNSALYFMAQLGARALNFLFFMLLANSLPTDEFGVLNYALGILVMVDIISDLGLSRFAMREMSKNPEVVQYFLNRILPYKIVISIVIYAMACLLIVLADLSSVHKWIVVLALIGLLFSAPSMFLENIIQANEGFGLISLAHIALSLTQFCIGGALLWAGAGTIAISLTFSVTNLVYLAFMLLGSMSLKYPWTKKMELFHVFRYLSRSLPYLLSAVVILLAIRAEFLILAFFGTPTELGVFGMASKLIEAALLLSLAFGTVMSPRFAKAFSGSPRQLEQIYLSGLELLLSLALVATLAAYALIPFLPFLFRETSFEIMPALMRIVLIGYPGASIFIYNTSLLFGAVNQRIPVAILTILMALQVLLNVLLQSKFGIWGAAWSFAIFMTFAALLSTGAILVIYADWRKVTGYMGTPLLGASIAGVVLLLLPAIPAVLASGVAIVISVIFTYVFWVKHNAGKYRKFTLQTEQ